MWNFMTFIWPRCTRNCSCLFKVILTVFGNNTDAKVYVEWNFTAFLKLARMSSILLTEFYLILIEKAKKLARNSSIYDNVVEFKSLFYLRISFKILNSVHVQNVNCIYHRCAQLMYIMFTVKYLMMSKQNIP